MSQRKKKQKSKRPTLVGPFALVTADPLARQYERASRAAMNGQHADARRLYGECEAKEDPSLRAIVANDLAVLDVLANNYDAARRGLNSALILDQACEPARLNLALLLSSPCETNGQACGNGPDFGSLGAPDGGKNGFAEHAAPESEIPRNPPCALGTPTRIAIVSFLFNWPSTGGGNIHTLELAQFLTRAGYEVRHFYARFPDWGIGNVQTNLPIASEALEFDETTWNANSIQSSFRAAVDPFGPDYVIVADSWNMKPILAEAVADYPYFLRFQAQECICPLNNLRLLAMGPETVDQCPRSQLATPEICRKCVLERGRHSGQLHHWERALAGVGTTQYGERLHRSLQNAEAVLVLNPLIGAMLEPYARRVRVIPWGMDTARFPWPPPVEPKTQSEQNLAVLFMAAVAGEFIKGAHVAHEACRLLRQSRSDFELVVTSDPPGRIDEFTRSVGWCSQSDLPAQYRAADISLVPTIAQDGLSRTSVEAMASGIPVVASRIGGLPFTVVDGVTGLLAEPGDPADLARQIAKLLDDPPLRRQMGIAGRCRFEKEFTWETVIERHYRPLLSPRVVAANRASDRKSAAGS
jgi:glycosyltransferase involved in cell wall biosynthesis